MNEPKRHHYIPQFILRIFCFDDNNNIHYYNKKTNQVTVEQPRDIFMSRHLYRDEIITPDTSNSVSYTGFKTAIPKRNRYMVDNASTAICYVNHISCGAYKTYQLAQKKNLNIINIKCGS